MKSGTVGYNRFSFVGDHSFDHSPEAMEKGLSPLDKSYKEHRKTTSKKREEAVREKGLQAKDKVRDTNTGVEGIIKKINSLGEVVLTTEEEVPNTVRLNPFYIEKI